MKIKIAFLCLAHNNFSFLEQVSHYYCSDDDVLFLHLDDKAEHTLLNHAHKKTVVVPKNERFRTRWGTFNIVKATIKLLQIACEHGHYDKFILISGADTPLLSKSELKHYLNNDLSYFSFWHQTATKDKPSPLKDEFFKCHYYRSLFTNPGEAYLTKSRTKIYTMLLLNKIIKLFPTNRNFNYATYVKGSQWWCMSHELAKYILIECSKKESIEQFEKMHAPDEKIFHTFAYNSPYVDKICTDYGQGSLKQGIHYIDWGRHKAKKVLQKFLLNDIVKAKALNCCFARKIENDDLRLFIQYIKKL
ncbi:MAG: hypothetical protein JKY81_03710 [Colwellia sp.]|nr:hypothetical protein [Colwellia sp.]